MATRSFQSKNLQLVNALLTLHLSTLSKSSAATKSPHQLMLNLNRKTPSMQLQTHTKSSSCTILSLSHSSLNSNSKRPFDQCSKTVLRSKSQRMRTCNQPSSHLSVDHRQAIRYSSLYTLRQAARLCHVQTSTVTRVNWRRSKQSMTHRAIRVIASNKIVTARHIILSQVDSCPPKLTIKQRSAILDRQVQPRINSQVARISSHSPCRYQALQ